MKNYFIALCLLLLAGCTKADVESVKVKHWRKNPLTFTYGYYTDEEIAEAEEMVKELEAEYTKPKCVRSKQTTLDDELFQADKLYEELMECGWLEVNQEEAPSSFQSNNTKFCTNCGTEVDVNAVACTNCGAALSDLPNAQNPGNFPEKVVFLIQLHF